MLDSNRLPVLLPDDIERQGAISVDDSTGLEELQSTQITDLVGFRATSPPLAPLDSEYCSLVQPGRQVLESELLPELPGTLITVGKPDEGPDDDVYIRFLRYPDGSGTKVAIKCISCTYCTEKEKMQMRIRGEAVIWKAVDHPNILRFIGYQMVEGSPWLVSPWSKHGNLTKYITDTPSITRAEKIDLLCGAARGLMHLHSLKPTIVHGNIKPENVMILDDLQPALSDFGLSRIMWEFRDRGAYSTPGNRIRRMGGYLSKELLEGNTLTPSVDVYAFGGLILAAMSGRDPLWKMKNDAARIVAICMEQMPAPKEHPGLPEDDPLWSLLRECWSADPTNRPAMATVLQQLEKELLTEV